MAFSFSIEGVENLQKAFEEKREEIEEVFIKDLDEGADIIVASAKSKVHRMTSELLNTLIKQLNYMKV